MTYIDRSVRKVLYSKFAIGIFENPYTDPNGASILDNPRHRELARVAAVEGTVLLKNTASVLPLDPSKVKRSN
jgi:beta-glucosidase